MVDWFGDLFKKEKTIVEYRSFNVTVQGASHIKANKVCQDCSGSVDGEKYKIAITCDGHGGNDYFRSEYGSKFAVDATLFCIQDQNFLSFIVKNKSAHKKIIESTIFQLEKSIIALWNQKIYEHFEKNPIRPDELELVSEKAKKDYLSGKSIESIYGTTLIAAFMIKDFWFAIQLGDGKCVILSYNEEWIQPIPVNDKCFLNQTTSMCDKDAFGNFRCCFGSDLPIAIFLGSDGVDDSFGYEDNVALNSFYAVVLTLFGTHIFDSAVDELKDYLPRLSSKGSGDDISIAGIINTTVAAGISERNDKANGTGSVCESSHENMDSESSNNHSCEVKNADCAESK